MSAWDRSHDCMLPPGTVVIAREPARRSAGRSRRAAYQTPRRRKLSDDERRRSRRDAGRHSLRDLAAEFDVSRETIRTVLRQREEARV